MPSTQIQWFPGHMAKTRRMIAENLKQVDLTIEVRDSRIPASSENPEIKRLTAPKPRLVLLSKSSQADPNVTAEWKRYFAECGENAIFYDCKTNEGIADIAPAARRLCSEKLKSWQDKGMDGRHLRAMIVGIPNVGKSSLINRLAADKKAKVEDRPGVTLNKQWVTTSIGIDLLDTPGVLWPKFDERRVGENLAITGAIKDDIMDTDELATVLCARLREIYPQLLMQRYGIGGDAVSEETQPWETVEAIGRKRGFLVRGGEVDFSRTAKMLLDELRGGKIGRISFEKPRGKK
ncbi:MAG: ribosome biogenesis GTPase YlqF [Eubacteriales bacterium]|nr:ribosome biogenesis GTPase YlqF [Eubacterium sp.]MDD7179686.1 ribosome biogenesis GTPase YlqF [Eubacterium sp.]MDY5493333.1 ribosome biogenesis GTPase YlqF [Eubacteriales bacterium]CDE18470.1 ribosome biogenesis GTPase A [Eubacterium sp. CAG:841]